VLSQKFTKNIKKKKKIKADIGQHLDKCSTTEIVLVLHLGARLPSAHQNCDTLMYQTHHPRLTLRPGGLDQEFFTIFSVFNASKYKLLPTKGYFQPVRSYPEIQQHGVHSES